MTSPNPSFQESILLVDYVLKMALVELSELDKQSIKTLQSTPEYQKDIIQLLECIDISKKSLSKAGKIAKFLISKSMGVKKICAPQASDKLEGLPKLQQLLIDTVEEVVGIDYALNNSQYGDINV